MIHNLICLICILGSVVRTLRALYNQEIARSDQKAVFLSLWRERAYSFKSSKSKPQAYQHLEPCHPLHRSMLRYRSTSKDFDIEVSSISKYNTSISKFNTSTSKLPKNFDIEVSSISKFLRYRSCMLRYRVSKLKGFDIEVMYFDIDI